MNVYETKWEYNRTIVNQTKTLNEQMNKMGQDRWEIVAFIQGRRIKSQDDRGRDEYWNQSDEIIWKRAILPWWILDPQAFHAAAVREAETGEPFAVPEKYMAADNNKTSQQ